MLYILIVLFIFLVITRIIYNKYKPKQLLEMSQDTQCDDIIDKLPDNLSICNEILENMNKKDVIVELNQNQDSTNSFYNVFNNKIILCNSEKANKVFTRLMFISHECVHSNQDKKFLLFNFILANINIIYLIVSLILIFTNVIGKTQYMLVLAIYLIINIFIYFARNMIETDATYMSLILSSKYLDKYLEKNEKEKIMNKYENIIHNGTSTFMYNIFITNFVMVVLYILGVLIKMNI